MKALPTLLIAVAAALGASFLYATFFTQPASDDSGLDRRLDQLAGQLSELREQVAKLPARDRRAAPPTAVPGVARQDLGELDDAVDRWLRENRPDLLPGAPVTTAELSAAELEAQRRARLGELLAQFDQASLTQSEYERIWKQIRDEGLIDEAIAVLEDRAAADPNNPDAQVALAGGYFEKINDVANEMEKGTWAMKADAVLDTALELDPTHWDARFAKAVSLSFWPPVMGKQGEAIRHFETLISQQEGMVPQSEHAQAYLFLGNMHQQMGNHAKAAEVWEAGLAMFPDQAELLEQLANAVDD